MIYKTLTGQFALFFLPLDKWYKIFFNKNFLIKSEIFVTKSIYLGILYNDRTFFKSA